MYVNDKSLTNAVENTLANRFASENSILSGLQKKDVEYFAISPHLELVHLPIGQNFLTKLESKYIYFPVKSIIILFTTMQNSSTSEVGIIGAEGVWSIHSLMGVKTDSFQSYNIGAEYILRIRADILKAEFDKGGELYRLVLHYMHAFYIQSLQTIACNKLHNVLERICRWLLLVRDRSKNDKLRVTQEFISQMLATRRPYVTSALGALQKKAIISCSRGQIQINDAPLLAEFACECYAVITEEFENTNKNAEPPRAIDRHFHVS